MTDLWSSHSAKEWRAALDRYDAVIARQDIPRLVPLDRWYREELPDAIAARRSPHVTHVELVKLTEMEDDAWRLAGAQPGARARQRRRRGEGGEHRRAR